MLRKLVLRPGLHEAGDLDRLLTGTEVLPLMEIDASTWVVPANPPPPNALALMRMLVMRNTRATPALVGGRIGMP
jgi:hypothetical protein